MRFRLTVILLLLNVALLSALYYFERSAASAERFSLDQRLVLSPIMVDEADGLRMERTDLDQRWELVQRQGQHWELVSPMRWAANPFAINRLFHTLRTLEWETRFTLRDLERAGQSLADYGLDEPRGVVRIRRGEEEILLRIGQATEVGQRLYILSPDEREVLVVNRELLASFAMELDDLRSEQVLSIPAYETRGLQVQTGGATGPKVRLRRVGGAWMLESPLEAAADQSKVEAALKGMESLTPVSFPHVDAEVHGLEAPQMRITLEGNNRRQTLLLGNETARGSRHYARLEDNPTVFTVASEPLEVFAEAQVTLRDRRLLRFSPESLSAIDVMGQDRSLTLQRLETGAWQVVRRAPTDRLQSWSAEAEVVQALLRSMEQLEAVRFGSDAPSSSDLEARGLQSPQRRITLRGETEQSILVGDLDPQHNLLWARLAESSSLYQIRPDILHRFPLNPLHYRSRTVESLPRAARVLSMELHDLWDDRTVWRKSIDPDQTTWAIALEDYPEEEREAILGLVEQVRRFRVEQYLRDSFADEVRLDAETTHPWRYRLLARIALPGGDGTQERVHSYHFTERTAGLTQFGGSREHNLIFLLRPTLMDLLHTLTHERDIPAHPEDETLPEAPQMPESGDEGHVSPDTTHEPDPATEDNPEETFDQE